MLRSKILFFLFIVITLKTVWAQDLYVYDSAGKRDPFIPLVYSDGRFLMLDKEETEEQKNELKLEGIIFDKYGLSYAMLNGAVVRVGESIEDYQILKIEEKKITLIRDGNISVIELKEE